MLCEAHVSRTRAFFAAVLRAVHARSAQNLQKDTLECRCKGFASLVATVLHTQRNFVEISTPNNMPVAMSKDDASRASTIDGLGYVFRY